MRRVASICAAASICLQLPPLRRHRSSPLRPLRRRSPRILSRSARSSIDCDRSSRPFAIHTGRGLRRSRPGSASRRRTRHPPSPPWHRPTPGRSAGPRAAPPAVAVAQSRPSHRHRRSRRRSCRLYNPAMSKVFNPDMAVIGNFLGATGKNDVNPTPALRLDEAEVTFQAVVDPYARADFFMSFTPESVEVEEGFLTLTSLPGGILAKVGKMKEQFGKVNTMHPHSLSWADKPLVMTNLLGGDEGIADSGISVSRLLINPLFFLEATGEVFAGTSGPFPAHDRSDVSWVGRLRGYRDVTEGTNLDVGTSFAYGHNELGPDFHTRLFGIDATFRYRPLQRAIYHRFLGTHRADLEPPRSAFVHRGRAVVVRVLRERGLPVRPAVVQRRALRLVGPCRGQRAAGQRRVGRARRSGRASSARYAGSFGTRTTRKASPRTSSCFNSCFRLARTARIRSSSWIERGNDEEIHRAGIRCRNAAGGPCVCRDAQDRRHDAGSRNRSPGKWAATRSRWTRSRRATRIRTSSSRNPVSS